MGNEILEVGGLMYKLKLYLMKFKRNAYDFLLRFIVAFSIIVVIKTSDTPMWDFDNKLLSNTFTKFSYDNAIYQAIFVGIIVSYIFYVIVVKLPEGKKKKNIDIVMKDKISNILSRSFGIMRELITQSGNKIELRHLKEDDIKLICSLVHEDSVVKNTVKGLSMTPYKYGEYLHDSWKTNRAYIDDALKINGVIDSEYLKLLYQLRDSKIWIIMSSLVDSRASIGTFENFSELFVDFFNSTKELNDYYYSCYPEESKNNPWDKRSYGYRIHIDFENKKIILHRSNCFIANRIINKVEINIKTNYLMGCYSSRKRAIVFQKLIYIIFLGKLDAEICEKGCL